MKEANRAFPINGILIVLIIVAGVLLSALLAHRYRALRSGKLTTYMGVLVDYAADHDGWYPRDGSAPLESLQKLYPRYDKAGLGLAGLSGDEQAVAERLKEGRPIDSTVSSWVYFPGFRNDDDPSISIIWERKEGISLIGKQADGHAVGFAGGGFNQVSAKEWPAFVKRQEELRRSTLLGRATDGKDFASELKWSAEQSKP